MLMANNSVQAVFNYFLLSPFFSRIYSGLAYQGRGVGCSRSHLQVKARAVDGDVTRDFIDKINLFLFDVNI